MSSDQGANGDDSLPSTSRKRYVYCFVPQCLSSTIATPEKRFFNVPQKGNIRKKWFELCRRDQGAPSTVFFCCEDHFDLEKDVSNLTRHQLMGCPMRLNPGILPSRFDCQPDRRDRAKSLGQRSVINKKRKLEILENCLTDDIEDIQEEMPMDEEESLNKSVAVQADLSNKSCKKGTQTIILKVDEKEIQCSLGSETMKKKDMESVLNDSSSSEEHCLIEETGDEDYVPVEDKNDKDYEPDKSLKQSGSLKQSIIDLIKNNPKGYIGLPSNQLHLIEMFAVELGETERDIFITLMKIKLNDTFSRIGDMFEISQQRVSQIFFGVVPKLAGCMKSLIFMPKVANKMSLPLAFRTNYSQVVSIIDCFEVEIEKPSDPVIQSLTWSEYKKANTMKYLVSCTPNGCVNYISEGCGGRTTDKLIVEKSGYLEKIPSGYQIMADRGFKHIEPLLANIHCQLVRPPSLETDGQFTEEEVHQGKSISALRIHVERLIRRFREFAMLRPHACIDRNLIPYLDCIVFICAGMVNLQPPLIKH